MTNFRSFQVDVQNIRYAVSLFGSLVSLQAQASSNVVKNVDIVVDTSECALTRSLSKNRNISERVHTLVCGDWESLKEKGNS